MSDLTDSELSARLSHALGDPSLRHFVEPLRELQRHRSALAADRERVRSVVRDVFGQCKTNGFQLATVDAVVERVADQLATARVVLSEDEVRALENVLGDPQSVAMQAIRKVVTLHRSVP